MTDLFSKITAKSRYYFGKKLYRRYCQGPKYIFEYSLYLSHFQLMFHSPPPLKTSERRTLSDIFRGYRRGELVENGQNNFTKIYQKVFHID